MSLSLDDRILGEKTNYYCSSSEDEDDERNDDGGKISSLNEQHSKDSKSLAEPELNEYTGHCTNTGPKGVIDDWRKFKQMENEKREDEEIQRLVSLKKLSLSCRTHLDDEIEKEKDAAFMQKLEDEFDEFEEEFLKEYRAKRLEELRKATENVPKFGKVKELSKSEFVEAIDKESPSVTVIVHVYEKNVTACESMNRCFECLSQEFPFIKFCRIRASEAQLSINFAVSGVPALLIYKNGELIGNFIHLTDEFGDEFYATDVESFLVENGLLPDNSTRPKIVKTNASEQSDSDSDLGID